MIVHSVLVLFSWLAYASPLAASDSGLRASPACYLTGAVYGQEKKIQENAKPELRLNTIRYEMYPDREDCQVSEREFKVEGTPFLLRMKYRAFCGKAGASYTGSLSDGGFNVIAYSKYNPLRDGDVPASNRVYLSSQGKSYSLSLTCL